jgi:hypothetical protein
MVHHVAVEHVFSGQIEEARLEGDATIARDDRRVQPDRLRGRSWNGAFICPHEPVAANSLVGVLHARCGAQLAIRRTADLRLDERRSRLEVLPPLVGFDRFVIVRRSRANRNGAKTIRKQ